MTTIYDLLLVNDIPRLDKRAILRTITGFTDSKLISHDNFELSLEQLDIYLDYLKRWQNGEPLAYILGYKEFYSRIFKVTPATLIPRPETELLVDMIIENAKMGAKVLDLGTGSGCIAISCQLERPDLQVLACDKYPATLAIAKENAKQLQAKLEFSLSDWFTNLNGKFDIIVSNPPYIEANDQHLADLSYEPQHALTDFADGLSSIYQIITGASKYLVNGGLLLIEHGYNQGAQVRALFRQFGFSEVESICDYASLERITRGTLCL